MDLRTSRHPLLREAPIGVDVIPVIPGSNQKADLTPFYCNLIVPIYKAMKRRGKDRVRKEQA